MGAWELAWGLIMSRFNLRTIFVVSIFFIGTLSVADHPNPSSLIFEEDFDYGFAQFEAVSGRWEVTPFGKYVGKTNPRQRFGISLADLPLLPRNYSVNMEVIVRDVVGSKQNALLIFAYQDPATSLTITSRFLEASRHVCRGLPKDPFLTSLRHGHDL